MKYKIIAPQLVFGKNWGLDFMNGVAETEDMVLAHKLGKKGYSVEEIKKKAKE